MKVLFSEEEPDEGPSNDGAEFANPLVDALFDEIEALHAQVIVMFVSSVFR